MTAVLVEHTDLIVTITLNRPDKMNAMTHESWSSIHDALRTAESEARVVVLKGEGRTFCAGNDLDAIKGCETPAEARTFLLDTMMPALTLMATTPVPIVSAVQGWALGVGLGLVLFSDVAVSSSSARFGLPEAKGGLWPTVFTGPAAYLGLRRLSQYLALTAASIDASEALTAGIVTKVVPDDELHSTAVAVAEQVAGNGPRALAEAKRMANRDLVVHGLPAIRDALQDIIDRELFVAR